MAKRVIGIILTVMGGIFLAMALLYGIIFGSIGGVMKYAGGSENEFLQEATTMACDGEVIRTDDGTTIAYEVEDTRYECQVSVTNSSYSVGTPVTVYYDKTDPTRCSVPELVQGTYNLLGNIFGGIGIGLAVAFIIVGVAAVVIGIILIRKSKGNKDTVPEGGIDGKLK